MTTFESLVERRQAINPVKPNFLMVPEDHAEHDLNWAYQQVRNAGKPAGDVEKYNAQAAVILTAATGLPSAEAGVLVCNYLQDRREFLQPFWEKAVRQGGAAMQEYRAMEDVLCLKYA